MRRYTLDAGAQRHGDVLIAGSPSAVFRLTTAGSDVIDQIVAGRSVADSPLVERLIDRGAIDPVPAVPARWTASDVTIVVPSLGRPPHPPAGARVVDDGSEPAIEGADVRLARTQGPAAARNVGLEAVTTPLVAFVDADVVVPDGWLDGLLGHFDDDRVALVAPRVASAGGTTSVARYESTGSPLDLGERPARISAGTRVSYVPAAAIVCRVDALRTAGGFDETLRFGEDVDLVWRLADAGWRLRYEPSVVVEHTPRATWPAWFAQRHAYGSSAATLAARHGHRRLSPVRVSGWSAAAWALALTRRPWTGLALGIASAAALIPKLPVLPARVSFRLAAIGNLRAGEQIAEGIRRVWWPVLVVAAVRSRVARRALVAALIVARDPVRIVDDMAYSTGVWAGMVRERTFGPAIPTITSWPGRSRG